MTVAGAGLHYGVITPEDTVYCPGHMKLGKYVFRCWKRGGHGETDLEKSLVESCDVYYYKLGKKLGVDRMSEYAFAAGYGKPTGISLPHEKGGLIPTRKWKNGDLAKSGIPART